MSRGNKLPFERGKSAYQNSTVTSTDLAHLEGQVVYLPHTNYSDNKKRDSNVDIVAVVARNVSGEALNAGDAVVWADGKFGKQVITTTDSNIHADTDDAAAYIAGIVDDQLPSAGVQNNDLFYLIVRGPAIATLQTSPTAHKASGHLFFQGGPLVASATKGQLNGVVIAATDAATQTTQVANQLTLASGAAIGGTARTAIVDAKTGSAVDTTSGSATVEVTVWVNTGIA